MSGNATRLRAIAGVQAYTPPAYTFDPAEAPGEIFGYLGDDAVTDPSAHFDAMLALAADLVTASA